ncbi:MAG: hypothetical protein O2975_07175 [Proteobacteria bacterium]|nr:hypothetical protein [Pseudomonadota bacterium]
MARSAEASQPAHGPRAAWLPALRRDPRFTRWFYGLRPPERGTIVLGHRRVYIVPTRLGWMYGATLGLLLVGAINYALSLGFVLTFLLAGLGLAGMVHTTRNLARLAISPGSRARRRSFASSWMVASPSTARRSWSVISPPAPSWSPTSRRANWRTSCSACRRCTAAGLPSAG